MRKITIALTLVLILLTTGLALAHGGHGHVIGTVTAVAADHIEVKTKDGKTANVPLGSETKFLIGKEKAARTDIHVGERVVVHLGAKGAAEEVRLAAARPVPQAPAHTGHKTASLTRVAEVKKVCMVNNRVMATDQIPVQVQGRTYYGCCPMCKQKLASDPAARTAIDPVSGAQVDKASAVIGAKPDGSVVYFENEANLKRYSQSKG